MKFIIKCIILRYSPNDDDDECPNLLALFAKRAGPRVNCTAFGWGGWEVKRSIRTRERIKVTKKLATDGLFEWSIISRDSWKKCLANYVAIRYSDMSRVDFRYYNLCLQTWLIPEVYCTYIWGIPGGSGGSFYWFRTNV